MQFCYGELLLLLYLLERFLLGFELSFKDLLLLSCLEICLLLLCFGRSFLGFAFARTLAILSISELHLLLLFNLPLFRFFLDSFLHISQPLLQVQPLLPLSRKLLLQLQLLSLLSFPQLPFELISSLLLPGFSDNELSCILLSLLCFFGSDARFEVLLDLLGIFFVSLLLLLLIIDSLPLVVLSSR